MWISQNPVPYFHNLLSTVYLKLKVKGEKVTDDVRHVGWPFIPKFHNIYNDEKFKYNIVNIKISHLLKPCNMPARLVNSLYKHEISTSGMWEVSEGRFWIRFVLTRVPLPPHTSCTNPYQINYQSIYMQLIIPHPLHTDLLNSVFFY